MQCNGRVVVIQLAWVGIWDQISLVSQSATQNEVGRGEPEVISYFLHNTQDYYYLDSR